MDKMLLSLSDITKKYDIHIKGVIHIGAHYGEEYEIYKTQNVNNFIFFEPLGHNFSVLYSRLKDKSDVILVNKALGATNDKVIMNVEEANCGQSSSVLKPKLHLQQYPHIVFNKKEEVDMITLDSYFSDSSILDFNFINIDVQGYELEVFKGSINTLKHIDYIITEVNRAELYENCCNVYELDCFLSSHGFARIETNWEGITWGDALYVKQDKI